VGAAASRASLRYIAEDGSTGYSVAAGRLVRALRDSGVDVEMLGLTHTHRGPDSEWVSHSRDDPASSARAREGAPTVMHLVPEHITHVRRSVAGPLIVHTVWETDRPPAHWPALLNRSDGVLVPTAWNRDAFRASGVRVPVDVVPHVVCAPNHVGRASLGISEELFVFYTIGRWDERKQPGLVVRAFLEAFTAEDPVMLVVKTGPLTEMPPNDGWGSDSPLYLTTGWQLARLLRRYPRAPRIQLWVDEWDDARICALHARGDCYLTLSHGEGWGVGSFDACAYGNPVIATGWGGHLAYLEGSASLVEYDLEAVRSSAPRSYSPDQRWARPRLEHAVELLRRVAANPAAARLAAAPFRERVLRDYAGPAVAERFMSALERFGVLDAARESGAGAAGG
jgi:glycosyltransferase involved in cell wall biosynthesis